MFESAFLNTKIIRYFVVGALGASLDLFLFLFIYSEYQSFIIANLISFHVALIFSFFLHYKYTHNVDKNASLYIFFIRYLFLVYFLFFCGSFILFLLVRWIQARSATLIN